VNKSKAKALITILILRQKDNPTFESYHRLREALSILEFDKMDREEVETYLEFRKDGKLIK